MVMCSWQLLRVVETKWRELGGKKEKKEARKEKRRKEAEKDRVKGRKEKTGFLAVSCVSLAKSRPVQDVNKLICQCEVFTHFGSLWTE